MIIEDLMLDLMYSLPGQKKVRECVITREVVQSKEKPITLIERPVSPRCQFPVSSCQSAHRNSVGWVRVTGHW
jgi:hypothetical protein